MTKKHFVDKKKFYECLEKRYSKVLHVKSRQQKYYAMLEKAVGSDSRKAEIRNKIKIDTESRGLIYLFTNLLRSKCS